MRDKVVAFVPIKLNSQRLPHKNILPFGDHSLSWYIFKNLLNVAGIDEIYVFCSDEIIMNYIPEGVKFLQRDSYLDGDMVQGHEIYQSFVNLVDGDIYLLAHTTSPFLTSKSIENALLNMLSGKYDSALSVQQKQTFIWYDGKPLNYDSSNIPRTQDIMPIYMETSGFYMFKKEHLLTYGRRIGFNPYFQKLNDIEAIDIDTREDYEFALKILETNKQIPIC
ncbi:acylneuraminate cytidylyltransferase family protein [Cytobacillus massiliigabonensis]|uniref:acylneuraminate cytidylyltransferase family protein n=1 Tax=Cytobacillus massiliigabonensis TaxID=1871011 RepID=UPI000C84071F|nr:HAD family hydrolase [Cytobacillus massiliigabonensis]